MKRDLTLSDCSSQIARISCLKPTLQLAVIHNYQYLHFNSTYILYSIYWSHPRALEESEEAAPCQIPVVASILARATCTQNGRHCPCPKPMAYYVSVTCVYGCLHVVIIICFGTYLSYLSPPSPFRLPRFLFQYKLV